MAEFLEKALATADVAQACAAVKIGMGDYLSARRKDTAFNAECIELDAVLRLAIAATVQARAATGDWRAARLVASGEMDVRAELASSQERLPPWLAAIVRRVQAGTIDPFKLAALEAVDDLVDAMQSRGKPPAVWRPGDPWRTSRFTASDVASLFDRRKYACADCGAIAYRLPVLSAEDHHDLDWHADDDARWSSDTGWRCATCGARAGLPWSPASKPPSPVGRKPRRPSSNRGGPPAECHDRQAHQAESAAYHAELRSDHET